MKTASPAAHGGRPTTRARWTVPLLAFVTILIDGFDTTSIGFVVPTLARDWGLAPAAFTPAFVATSLGAVIGYMCSGAASARFSRRSIVLASVAAFAIGSCATAWVGSVAALAWIRLLTGIGLGAAIPACISLAVEHASPRHREAMTVAVAAGLAMGATLGGVAGGPLIAHAGWPAVFWVGGLLPALLLPLLWRGLPVEAAPTTLPVSQGPAGAPAATVGALFNGALKLPTLLLWGFSFMIFTATYAMSFWTPTLLLAFGFSPADAPRGAAALGAGGVLAALLLVPLTAWCGIRPVLVATTLGAVALVVLLSQWAVGPTTVLLCIGGLGACLISGTLGQAALAVSIYGAASRTTGVGWSAALGRMGSILGPALAGSLLAAGHAPREVLLTLALPTALAILGLLGLARSGR